MHDFHRILLSSEVRDLTDEVGRLFDDIDRATGGTRRMPSGHCNPAFDVQETPEALEVVMDLPGVAATHVRVLLKNGALVIAGEKPSPYPGGRGETTFHLVERGFGRFARAVRLSGAFHTARASATLANGELRVRVPKVEERRGRDIAVPVRRGPDA